MNKHFFMPLSPYGIKRILLGSLTAVMGINTHAAGFSFLYNSIYTDMAMNMPREIIHYQPLEMSSANEKHPCRQSGETKDNRTQATVYKRIFDNIFHQETTDADLASIDKLTDRYINLLDKQGGFTDIDYTSHAQTTWKPVEHLIRMKSMIVSYVAPGSKHYADDKLYHILVKMFNYWYESNPTSTNWWYHEIGWAQPMGLNLSLMRNGKRQIPRELEQRILNRMKTISKGPDQKGSPGTGANKMDIALQWIYRTCLQEDQANLEFAIDQFFFPIRFNPGEGIQSDYSYLQHSMQLYTGGYGASVLTAYFKVAFYLEGTPYADEEKNLLISNFVRLGYLPAVRGKEMLYNAVGRGITRPNGTDRSSFAGQLEKLIQLDPVHKEEYLHAIRRMKGKAPADYALSPFHRHYWRADHTIHQRKAYTIDVRMASTRTFRCENGNGDNLRGYFITEGGTGIVRRGDEYAGIYPVWDWSSLPGTTTPKLKEVPVPQAWSQRGQSNFAGGVSDGTYGVTAYQMTDRNFNIHTTAKKAWFFFDNEVVCMGSDICSSNSSPIHTTVNQCLLKGRVSVLTADTPSEQVIPYGNARSYDKLRCVNHDSISYYFPDSGEIQLRNAAQKGNMNYIASYIKDTTTIKKDVFKLGIEHGNHPQKVKYLYYIVPDAPSASATTAMIDQLYTVNTDTLQAVYNKSLNQLGVVFHRKGCLHIKGMEIESTTPCVVLFTQTNKKHIKVYIADPSHSLKSTTLTVRFPKIRRKKRLDCQYKTDPLFRGETHAFEIHNGTPDAG